MQTLNSCRSLGYARGNKSTIYFNSLCKPIEMSMLGKSTHWQVIQQQSTRMQQTWGYRHATKTSGLFLVRRHGRQFQQYCFQLGFLCKSFHSCKIYNSLFATNKLLLLQSPADNLLTTSIYHTKPLQHLDLVSLYKTFLIRVNFLLILKFEKFILFF